MDFRKESLGKLTSVLVDHLDALVILCGTLDGRVEQPIDTVHGAPGLAGDARIAQQAGNYRCSMIG